MAKSIKNGNFVLLAGNANHTLAQQVADILKTQVYNPVSKFADGESRVKVPVNMRRRSVFIIQPTSPPHVDNYFVELLLMIDAARRGSAERIVAVIPYLGYSRQDRKEGPRVPVSAALMMRVIEYSGAHAICTVDIHSDQQQGFIHCPMDNLYGSYSLIPHLRKLATKNLVVASPDKSGVPRATTYATLLDADGVAFVYKERDVSIADNANNSQALDLIGNVQDKNVLLLDDMIDTAGTLVNAASLIQKKGAKKIFAAATHGLFSGPAIQRITDSVIEKVFVTDTVPQEERLGVHPKIEVVSVAPLLAEAIKRIYNGESISEGLIL
jgi:ribose-phosphate pyrophosphokinase